MKNKPLRWALIALIIGLIALTLYFQWRVPPGVQPMGDNSETIAWISLAVGVLSLLTALTGLITAIIEARNRRG